MTRANRQLKILESFTHSVGILNAVYCHKDCVVACNNSKHLVIIELVNQLGGFMLRQLCIENVALIDKLELTLENGLNILSGETGVVRALKQ